MKYVLSFIALILCLSVSFPTLCISQNINVKQEKKLSKKERKALKAAAMEAEVMYDAKTRDSRYSDF